MYAHSQKTEVCRKTALALFDFDGTLCQIDSYSAFLKSLYPKHRFYQKCLGLLPHICGYYLGYYPAHLLRPKLSKALLNGIALTSIEPRLTQFTVQILSKLTPVVYQKLLWHKQQGHDIYIVSAGLDLYLAPIATALDVGLICTQLESQTLLNGTYLSADCSCEEKVKRIKRCVNLQTFTDIYAYGNSKEDHAMLAIANHAWLVHGDKMYNF